MAIDLDDKPKLNPVKEALERLKVDGYGADGFDAAGARDGYQRPLVKDASDLDGSPKPMQRPSTRAKALDEAGGLVRWKAGMAAMGAAIDPARTSRLLDLDLTNPKHRSFLYNEADELADLAGAKEGADYGSLVHALVQAWVAGADWEHYLEGLDEIRDQMIRAVASVRSALIDAGIEVLESEVCCVNEEQNTAGSTDGIGRRGGVSRIFDIKTTKPASLRQSWPSFLVQCRLYSRSACLYDPVTGHRRPFPEDFDRDNAWIVHVDWRAGRTVIYDLDLTAADRAIELANEVFEWRTTAGRYVKVTDKADDLEEVLERSVAQAKAERGGLRLVKPEDEAETKANWDKVAAAADERATSAEPPAPVQAPPARPAPVAPRNGGREDLLDYVRVRVDELVNAGHGERLMRLWTENELPGIGPSHPPVDADTLNDIGQLLTNVEQEVDLYVHDPEIDELRARYAALSNDDAQDFVAWMTSLGWNPTHRVTRGRADASAERLDSYAR